MAISRNLRELAEGNVQSLRAETRDMTADEVAKLIYELQIHQEELEIQNEALRQAQLELEETRDRYVDLYDFAPVGYLTLNAKGEIVEANLTSSEMLCRDRSRLIGTPLALHCDADSRAKLRGHLDDVLATGVRHSVELRLPLRNGIDVLLETCRAEKDVADQYHCRTILTDITDRKQAEYALREKDQRLRSLADALPVLISYLNTDFRIQFCNAAYEEWFGAPGQLLTGCRIQDAIANPNQDLEAYLSDAQTGRRVEFETQLNHRHQGVRDVQIMLVPDFAPDKTVKGIHSLCIDISERKLIEQQNSRRHVFTSRMLRLNAGEKEVYELLVRGKSNKAISLELDIGLRTAERRRQSVFAKLEVESLAELLQHLSDIQNVGAI